ncbi:MAG: hypothetical protein G01um101420_91 [Parcubacteria group bacterium Gr01-1014_20]|nr:MAG: hypothetical protein G01um101420_91 [Parcubacteria group bacterium Gr01-1014_20]
MGQKIVFIAIIIFISAVVLYSFQSGFYKRFGSDGNSTSTNSGRKAFFKSLDFANPQSRYISQNGTGSSTSSTKKDTSVPKPSSTKPIIATENLPVGFTINQISPFWQKVVITTAQPGTAKTYSRINLSSYLNQSESFTVTGWVIKAKKGEYLIPRANEVYSSYSIPKDIAFKSGERMEIYSSRSPVGNLKLNKCTGYLETLFDFTPPLPQSCPRAYESNSDLYQFTPKCQDYIRSLGSCKMPETNFLWLTGDSACRSFLDTINYAGCFREHQADSDFLTKNWRVWMDRKILQEGHDRVLLFDLHGLLVDEYTY